MPKNITVDFVFHEDWFDAFKPKNGVVQQKYLWMILMLNVVELAHLLLQQPYMSILYVGGWLGC